MKNVNILCAYVISGANSINKDFKLFWWIEGLGQWNNNEYIKSVHANFEKATRK